VHNPDNGAGVDIVAAKYRLQPTRLGFAWAGADPWESYVGHSVAKGIISDVTAFFFRYLHD
jgi:hypothetical protein